MKKRNMIALGIFFVFYVSFGTYITLNQEKVIYQPWAQDFEHCPAFSDAEKVTYKDTRMYTEVGEKGVVVLYHGNAGSACDRSFYAEQFRQAGYGYIIVEYAGYSNDAQKPTHEHIKQDVANVVSYLAENNIQKVSVVGESIGTGVASYHTSLLAPEKVLLISPFASLKDLAQRKFWFYPTFLLVDNAYDNTALLSEYSGPITILHGDTDKIISQKSGKKLFESLNTEKKIFVSIEGYGHNNLFYSMQTFDELQKFLAE